MQHFTSWVVLVGGLGQGALFKVYHKGGRQFGAMKINRQMQIVSVGKDKEKLKFTGGGAKFAIDVALDVCIDGTSEDGSMTMKSVMIGSAAADVAGLTITLHATVEAAQAIAELPAGWPSWKNR